MREIKFRGWNGASMEYGGFCIHATAGRLMPLPALSQLKVHSPFMQFTGIRDKHHREIYEGDIVNLRGAAQGPQSGEVIFSERAAKFAVRVRRNGYRKDETHLVSLLQCEVIGNIYENSELLK